MGQTFCVDIRRHSEILHFPSFGVLPVDIGNFLYFYLFLLFLFFVFVLLEKMFKQYLNIRFSNF